MIPFVIALDAARSSRRDIDYFVECENAWVFSRELDRAPDGRPPVVVLKGSGEVMDFAAYEALGGCKRLREGLIADAAASKDGSPRIPIVAAQAFTHGITYEDSLAMYEGMTEEQRASADETCNRDNMGYGLDAWMTYQAVCRMRSKETDMTSPTACQAIRFVSEARFMAPVARVSSRSIRSRFPSASRHASSGALPSGVLNQSSMGPRRPSISEGG